ncbi:GNAT family N-acetyltransferase [Aeromicrobium wangtongii]|uniref:GNAT family N-acetyltransferase n=1 Tax=Aeromicrobium wangtongii TaxID=2969247 RepID=A0ABY5M804_9ACTN|nr:GNAT family N-acetyltransferase [Aeromicrobium wangtongii]MCD9198855.1 GNAT family N-acetyltransferase [Aeromicrobium wangtongii]UUP13105.1 GNAT family N-acetyltransferase [Aeromicrobium wangtongii]
MTGDLRLERVAFDQPDAVALRDAMVDEVNAVYGSQRDYGSNGGAKGIDPASVVATIVGYVGERPVAHALLRRLGDDIEIKRMYVRPEARGQGGADALMAALEDEARAAGARRLILHTGDRQDAAIRIYQRHGYTPIEVYQPYVGMPASLCFEKLLG